MPDHDQTRLDGTVETDDPVPDPGDDTGRDGLPGLEMPVCCIDGCETEVPGLDDGWDASGRDGVACNDCWAFHDRHGHWPDEDPRSGHCVECRIDAGAVRHDCPEWGGDIGSVIMQPDDECSYCGDVPEGTEGDGS